MKYRNAKAVLPKELLAELQKYAEGELIYIPGRRLQKAGWGTLNGSRESYALRNNQIMRHFRSGASVTELSERFFLSKDSVKKIIKAQPDKDLLQ
jgi:Mor family transcriptional regulator